MSTQKETKRAPSHVMLAQLDVDLQGNVVDFSNSVTTLDQCRHLVVPITKQILGTIRDRSQKRTPLTNYVYNIIFGSYHNDQVDFVKALQTSVDLVSIYLLDQRKGEREAIVLGVDNVANYLGCLYLLKTEGLEQEMDRNTVAQAYAFVRDGAGKMSDMITDFKRRYFNTSPMANSSASSSGSTSYYDTPTQVTNGKFIFSPIKVDNHTWLYDPVTKRVVYSLETDNTFRYVHVKGDTFKILNRNLEFAGEAEFPNCIVNMRGQPKPNPAGYADNHVETIIPRAPSADEIQRILNNSSEIKAAPATGSAILEEVTFDPNDEEVEVKVSASINIEDSQYSSFATGKVTMNDFVNDEKTGEQEVSAPQVPSKYSSVSKTSDGSTLTLVSPDNAAETFTKFRSQEVGNFVKVFYPEREMMFVNKDHKGEVTLKLTQDKEVLMDTMFERMRLASGISRTRHEANNFHQRQSADENESYFSDLEVSVQRDAREIIKEQETLTTALKENPDAEFVYDPNISVNNIEEAKNLGDACARVLMNLPAGISPVPFRQHDVSSFILDQSHPAEKIDQETGACLLSEVLSTSDVDQIVKFLISDYGMGSKLENMTAASWYIADRLLSVLSDFVSQDLNMPGLVTFKSIATDYFAFREEIRKRKGEVVANAMKSKSFMRRALAAIGYVQMLCNESNNAFLISFTQVNFGLYLGMKSTHLSFVMLDSTVLVTPEQVPALHSLCMRFLDTGKQLEANEDGTIIYDCSFITSDNRVLRVMQSPYSGDILLTSRKAHPMGS